MRTITIVGAGQAGLQLGIGLVDEGYDVTIISNRTAEEIENGRVMSSQVIFGNGRAREAALGLDFWNDAPEMDTISVTVPDGQGGKALYWSARMDLPAHSIDQRVKYARWIREFISRGGTFEVHTATIDDLEEYARSSDLVLVAAGKGEISGLFERNPERSPYDSPQRAVAVAYLNGVTTRAGETPSTFSYNVIPGVGEFMLPPALTTTGPCRIAVVSAVPGGPFDVFRGLTDPQEHLSRLRTILDTFLPWEAERVRDAELTDDLAVLAGAFAPTVRNPVGVLPSGATVLGMGDVLVLNDPITGQGSNTASKCAASYLASILERGDQPFDDDFKSRVFERFWDYAKYVTEWTNAFLAPPPPHVMQILGAAAGSPRIARRFVNGFDEPRDFFLWFTDPAAAGAYLQEAAGAPALEHAPA
ncbi:styrene monooxygenase/indole monooxygenase family protein [Nocardia sp. R7R-8]|uniref:styrene monooxygenase/indole monooxygenase family protein n=1 Tax=Nocardia sp. R7R-8 TaxID=3459304 RepID=UPI00403DFAD2